MAEALAAVRQDLGVDAVILNTRTFHRGGILGIGRKTIIEVTATPNGRARASSATRSNGHASSGSASDKAQAALAKRGYAGQGSAPLPSSSGKKPALGPT